MLQRTVLPVLVALLGLLAGCSSYRHEAFRLDSRSVVVDPQSRYELRFVEADDEGWFWQPQQASDVLEAVKASAAQRNTFVLLFVHGWHHSSRCCDSNVESFKRTLARLHDELAKSVYREARGEGTTASERFRLIGVYLGWRGRSLPGPLNYLTFWGRKSAAEKVGENDTKEFIARLNRIYLEHPEKHPDNFLGLISIGHSFGGQVLVRALAAKLEQQLIDLRAPPGYLRQRVAAPPTAGEVALQGIGDLVVLINPATEAAAYHRLHLLSMGLRYNQAQTPVMFTISAENDSARRKLFTLGRIFGEIFTGKPRKADPAEREIERLALGIDGTYVRHVTHTLEPVDPDARLIRDDIEQVPEQGCEDGTCVAQWMRWAGPAALTDAGDALSGDDRERVRSELRSFDFSSAVTLGQVKLQPQPGAIPYQPLIVATASSAIIDNHSGIFTEPFLKFLIPYIALIETKIARNPAESQAKKRRAR